MFWRRLKYRKCFDDYCVTRDGKLIDVRTKEEVWPGLKNKRYLGEFDLFDVGPKILPVNKNGDPPGIHRFAIWKKGDTPNSLWVSVGGGIGHYMLEYEPRNDYMVYRYFPLSDGFYELAVPWEHSKYFWALAGRPLGEFKRWSELEKVRLIKKYSPFENELLVFMNISPGVQEFVLRPGVYVRIENDKVRLGTVSINEIHQVGFDSSLKTFVKGILSGMDLESWLKLDSSPEDLYTLLVF